MKIYVASSWRNIMQPAVVEALVQAGHEVYDFRNPSMGPGARGKGFHWSGIDEDWKAWTPDEFRNALLHPVAVDGFKSDLTGMEWADAFVLVMPCGRSAHLELGWAIGAGKPTVILLDDGEPELMYGLADYLATDLDEALRYLVGVDKYVDPSLREMVDEAKLDERTGSLLARINRICVYALNKGYGQPMSFEGAVNRISELVWKDPDPPKPLVVDWDSGTNKVATADGPEKA